MRRPLAPTRSTTASSAASTGSPSPAGEQVARLPPTVPALRICGLPDRARRLGQRRQHRPQRLVLDLGPGHGRAERDRAGRRRRRSTSRARGRVTRRSQSASPSAPREAAVTLVDLDHQVGATGQQRRSGIGGEPATASSRLMGTSTVTARLYKMSTGRSGSTMRAPPTRRRSLDAVLGWWELGIDLDQVVPQDLADHQVADPFVVGRHDIPRRLGSSWSRGGRRRTPPGSRPTGHGRRDRRCRNFQRSLGSSTRSWSLPRCSSLEMLEEQLDDGACPRRTSIRSKSRMWPYRRRHTFRAPSSLTRTTSTSS